jgi:hypothetical protein
MSAAQAPRPAFQSVELDPIDARLEAKAMEKGIPTLVAPSSPKVTPTPSEPKPPAEHDAANSPASRRGDRAAPTERTPRKRMKALKFELPDYAWIEIKIRSAEKMVSVRYFLMDALRTKGIYIDSADMVEDGRRFRD